MQSGSSFRRLVYDIGLEVDGVPFRIELAGPEYVENNFFGDVWTVMPASNTDVIAKSRLAAALSHVTRGLIGNRAMPRQDYRVRVSLGRRVRIATIMVAPDKGPIKNVSQGLAASPGWDGHSFDFQASHRVACLIADISDGVLGARLFRSNQEPITGFEQFTDLSKIRQ